MHLLLGQVEHHHTEPGVPKIKGTFFGVPIIRTRVFGGLDWGPIMLGNYHLARKSANESGSVDSGSGGSCSSQLSEPRIPATRFRV